jgi:septal ring factor EnvC (AmiA/AmiB activator)
VLREVYDLARTLLRLGEDLRENREEVKEIRAELRELAGAVQRLAFEIARVSEREDRERALLALRLENQLLRDGAGALPPP